MRETTDTELELHPDRLAWSCPPGWLSFGTTDDLESCDEDLGQGRAVDALRLALRLEGPGYNVFVAGISGTGRTRVARRILREEASQGRTPDDICYVNNFADPKAPRLLRLPPGKGRALRAALEAAAEAIRDGIAALRSSAVHRERRERVAQKARAAQTELVSSFESKVEAEGFALVELDLGAYRQHAIAAVVEGQPVSMDDLENLAHEGKLAPEQVRTWRARYPALAARLSETMSAARSIGRDRQKELERVDREAARPLVESTMEELRAALGIATGERPTLDAYLGDVVSFLTEIVPYLFSTGERVPAAEHSDQPQPDPFAALRVAVLVDRTGETGRPLVEETNPDPARLFGHVEIVRGPDGSLHADLTGLRAGALLRADGGFLLLDAQDLVSQEGSWAGLRRALRAGKVDLFLGGRGDGPPPLVPEAVPIDVKVVLVGTPGLRAELADQDPDFTKMFKVVALFENHVPLTREHVRSYACFLAQVIREEGLLHHDAGAVARNLELLIRASGGRGKLSTNFRLFTDIARESTFVAREDGAAVVTRDHVHEAIDGRSRRSALLSQRIIEAFRDGVLLIDISGEKIGQVNGLAVVQTNVGRVGYPVRITATAAVGRAGIIDIEREAELSGEIHTKASLILAGFLRSQFAQNVPLSVTSSICFEQSYGGVDGDSASSAELAALLSALGKAPVRQDLAITGAVDQHGQVLAVGGVNHKVEGFWRLCRQRGLTGRQGVVIPAASASGLQLLPELVEDVRDGRFHVYAVTDIGQLMELLTGVPLGRPDAEGAWPPGLLGARVAERLEAMAEIMRVYGPGAEL